MSETLKGSVQLSVANRVVLLALIAVPSGASASQYGLVGLVSTLIFTALVFGGLGYRRIDFDAQSLTVVRLYRRQKVNFREVTMLSYHNEFELIGRRRVRIQDQYAYNQRQLEAMFDHVRRLLGKQEAYIEIYAKGREMLTSSHSPREWRESSREFNKLVLQYNQIPVHYRSPTTLN